MPKNITIFLQKSLKHVLFISAERAARVPPRSDRAAPAAAHPQVCSNSHTLDRQQPDILKSPDLQSASLRITYQHFQLQTINISVQLWFDICDNSKRWKLAIYIGIASPETNNNKK